MREGSVLRALVVVLVLLVVAAPSASAAPAVQAGCTYRATYISDVTIPDNTVIAPNTTFVKTWRIRNDGSCPWGPGQSVSELEMVGGTAMAGSTRVPLNNTVRRGETADISIKMQSPAVNGTYGSEWKFRRNTGQLFGVGATGVKPFFVQIVVRSGSTVPPDGERISFPAGATVTAVQGRVSDNGMKTYLVRARAGQPMRVGLVSANPDANFSVVGVSDGQPYKRVEVGEPWFFLVLPSSQDYQITVRVASGAGSASYVLAIAIAP